MAFVMKVILEQDVKGQGKKGQLVEVSDGYARNYLLPRKLAVEANKSNMSELHQRDSQLKKQKERERKAAAEAAERLQACTVKIHTRSGPDGKLFGSVTAQEIAGALKEQTGIDIDKHKIVLDEPIKHQGSYEIKVKLGHEINGTLYIVVV